MRIAFGIVAVLVGVAALAFGAVESWASAWLLVGAVVAFTAVLWDDPLARLRAGALPVLLPAVLVIVWGALQSVPLPAPVVRALTPRTARIQASTLPAGGGAAMPSFLLDKARASGITIADATPVPQAPADRGSLAARSSLSIKPAATRRACLTWLAAVLLAFVAERLSRDRLTRYRLLWAVAFWTGVLGAIALLQRVAGNGKLLWIREAPADSMPLGPFVNPNHFAAYVELGVLVAFGLVLAILGGSDGRLSRENVRAALVDRGWAVPRLIALGAFIVLGTCGLILSGSRGGPIALAAGLLVLLPLRRLRALVPAAIALVVLAGLALGLASWLGREERTLQSAFFVQSGTDPSLAMRSDIWGRTWRVIVDHPLTGTGLGTFPWAYATYDREGEWLGTLQAHNDYLQLISDTGLIGLVLLVWLIVAALRRGFLPALRPATGRAPWTTIALAAAVFAMIVHSVIEFNFQIPAVAALFAVLSGMLLAAAGSPEESPGGSAS
ncbi:MAG TPA: O-antigen ligase family protein [Candidatus Bathyarchaeia archaeon]|nr:O-antigen ligase family protein [Candidatus Bathyarchaeia archaeon]